MIADPMAEVIHREPPAPSAGMTFEMVNRSGGADCAHGSARPVPTGAQLDPLPAVSSRSHRNM